jgi:c-di-GMP-binding flagellar brake protein YcgR
LTNQRQFERYDLVLPLLVLHGETELRATSRNISLGGMLIDGTTELPFGTAVKIRIHLPSMKEHSDLPATIRWVRDGAIGVQFGSLRAKETWALNQLAKPT